MTGNNQVGMVVTIDISDSDRCRTRGAEAIEDGIAECAIAMTEVDADAVRAVVGHSEIDVLIVIEVSLYHRKRQRSARQ